MAQAGTTVDTWDLMDKWSIGEWPDTIERSLGENPDAIRTIDFSPYDMIFLDIDHSGVEEQKLHSKFIAEYKGLVFYDDIILNQAMVDFWGSIEQDKQSCAWHGNSGFGLVRY